MKYDAVIIGGGAAGLLCAIEAGKRGRRVAVLEHNSEVGRKILISGGGRCNFTNIHTRPENFISDNPHFCKSALSRYTPQHFLDLVNKYKIPYFEKKLGQLFCRESSRFIVEMLLAECNQAGVEIVTTCSVKYVRKDDHFLIGTASGDLDATSLVVACGGLSFPKTGASDLGYRIARQFGLEIMPTRPSLVALVMEGGGYKQLAGVSIDASVSAGRQSFRENILFTHRGLSGPAILQISNYWKHGRSLSVDLIPDIDAAAVFASDRMSRQYLGNYLAEMLPNRFAEVFAKREFANKPLYQMNDREVESLSQTLHNWQVNFTETEGYDRAEVTLGGVSTDELSSTSMEAKRVRGLYFIGEVVDVTGWLGGYNFQWAWSSGFAAGNAI